MYPLLQLHVRHIFVCQIVCPFYHTFRVIYRKFSINVMIRIVLIVDLVSLA